jgi:hypothetical protein
MQIDDFSRNLLHVQNNHGQFYFFKCYFSLSNVQHYFSKLERILILMINFRQIIEIFEINFYNTLSAFNSNAHLTFKFMNFDYVSLKNIIDVYMVKNMDA